MSAPRAPRPEVARSREQLLDAAEKLFETRGLEFSLHDLATQARLGVATTYRRFSSHDDVIRALHARAYESYVGIYDDLEGLGDGWSTVVGYLERAVAMNNAHPIFPATARRMAHIDPDSTVGADLAPRLQAHVERAQAEGTLRSDVNGVDLVAIVAELGVLTVLAEPARSTMAARHLRLITAGLRVESQAFGDLGASAATDMARLRELATRSAASGRRDSPA
ncbi:TetR/AcrR family transcriptional regulator [Microbacterium xanthum]|uniref:TetR/AcrR family transcriptional regulator n=1 Tax=Microbacterium xanthum TaxID=3079794 RepID=UPI002AD34E95|nr:MULTISPECIES: helix-turn-helix domain-containing protein [unclassified Microbacterium]MDZ8171997.1 helix-turn-helix domain-containing protein [Microbacterium sp. KSW-48]MDZ8199912.1 helix-turn-helix domain-containing protein [Microbacterium sp. SSW1-59]